MSKEYENNHYVPIWYQKQFLPVNQKDQELYYLDLNPSVIVDPRGVSHPRRAVRRLGFKYCFAEKDLYTRTFGEDKSKDIEKNFFGEIDRNGHQAVKFFADFKHGGFDEEKLNNLVRYMSTQKLRTIKGLGWLTQIAPGKSKEQVLSLMVKWYQLYCAIWTECVWSIADASQSETKFIVSDHPVTVYNRRCGPSSQWCKGLNDPDIRFHATHSVFPLSLDKVLILTNLSWVRNPYQKEVELRPNPDFFRGSLFKLMDIQISRCLTEHEVRQINFIIKSRAKKHIGAAREEWLYPEKYVSKSQWNTYGNGYLLMPEPRCLSFSKEVFMSFADGTSTAFDEYGRRPWQKGFGSGLGGASEFSKFQRFQGEFARLFGRKRRGRCFHFNRLSEEEDSEEMHQHYLNSEKKK